MKYIAVLTGVFMLLGWGSTEANAQLRIVQLYSDEVMQRDAEVPVWGWTTSSDNVVVTLSATCGLSRDSRTWNWP